jgi:hypothetical protein
LIIHDIPVDASAGSAWASLPSKAMVEDGRQLTDERGKLRWSVMAEWETSETRFRFSESVVSALLAKHPDALDGDDPQ